MALKVGGTTIIDNNLSIVNAADATFTGNTAIKLPSGNTSARPVASNGMIRYNSDSGVAEIYANSSWSQIADANSSVTLTSKKLQAYTETVNTIGSISSATYTIDTSTANIFDVTLGANVTFSFSNAPASGTSRNCTIILRQDANGNRTASFTNGKYTDGSAPVLSTGSNQIDVLTFFTVNGGSFWFGTYAMANVA
jgi:hypothetical protein